LSDLRWVEAQLAKRSSGERSIHAVRCKDSEGYKGWLVLTDQRIWYFQEGAFGSSEEFDHGVTAELRRAPFGLNRAQLLLGREPFEMPIADAEEFLSVLSESTGQ
jgi:hypothetical protein